MSKYNRPQDVQPPAQGSWQYVPEVAIFTNTDHIALQTQINIWIADQVPLAYKVTLHDVHFSTCSPKNNVTEFSALVHYTITLED